MCLSAALLMKLDRVERQQIDEMKEDLRPWFDRARQACFEARRRKGHCCAGGCALDADGVPMCRFNEYLALLEDAPVLLECFGVDPTHYRIEAYSEGCGPSAEVAGNPRGKYVLRVWNATNTHFEPLWPVDARSPGGPEGGMEENDAHDESGSPPKRARVGDAALGRPPPASTLGAVASTGSGTADVGPSVRD